MKPLPTLLIILLSLSLITPAFADQNQDLVAHYPFNGNVNDESGNGNHGMVYGATLATDRFGNENSAYEFYGVDDYINLPSASILGFLNSSFTVSVWIKGDSFRCFYLYYLL